jgi:hypothetical protein
MLIVDRMRKEINDECKTFDLFLDILAGVPHRDNNYFL